MHHAAGQGHLEVCRLLVDCVSQNDITSTLHLTHGVTPLYDAAESGHFEVCRLLLENYGGQMNTARPGRHTPLDRASANGHSEIVELIKSYL